MNNNEINTIIKVVGILGIIFSLFTLLTPWGSSAFTFGYFDESHSIPFYIGFFTNQEIVNSNSFNQIMFFAITMIIIFILTIFALVSGMICIVKADKEVPSTFLMTSLIFISSVIIYTAAVSLLPGIAVYSSNHYSFGFISALISFIIFFILFILKSFYYKKIEPKRRISDDDAIKILKLRYARGEITKEQYEQTKKEIEG